MAKTAIDRIREMVRGRTTLNSPMSELTTLRIGGAADMLIHPADREDLARLLPFLREKEIPSFVLGRGSNLVVRDGGIRGAVLSLEDGFRALELARPASEQPTFRAEAGVSLGHLIRWTAESGLAGFESLAGIPGSVGGALAMNAGAWGFEFGERVLEVEVMDVTGRVARIPKSSLGFAYRRLELAPGSVVLGALLQAETAPPDRVKARVQEFLHRRRDRQPIGEPSAGSVFKNPPGDAAGRLIEECGLKGVRVGDAEVSRIHANFIVNLGAATAKQVVKLMGMIQERVLVRHKIRLEPEVIVVGDWEHDKLRIRE